MYTILAKSQTFMFFMRFTLWTISINYIWVSIVHFELLFTFCFIVQYFMFQVVTGQSDSLTCARELQ